MTDRQDCGAADLKANGANIAHHLIEAITSGHFSVGDLLPTELALCTHYGASRYSVRAALAELQALGLVSRRKNVGTRVVSDKPRPPFRSTLATLDDLVQFGEKHRRVVQSMAMEKVEGRLAAELGCEDGSTWFKISTLRLETGSTLLPLAFSDIYVDPAYASVGSMLESEPRVLTSSLIEEHHGRQVAEIQQEVQACTIDDPLLAQRLQVCTPSSALRVLRRYLDGDGVLFEASSSIHPEGRFTVSMVLRR